MKYIVVYGVLFWGVLTGLGWAVAMSALQGWDRLEHLVFGLIGFPVGGILFGMWVWTTAERQYRQAHRERKES